MNRALLYLWLALLKSRIVQLVRSLRRPTTLLAYAAVAGLFALLFHFRHEEIFRRLVHPDFLKTAAFLMLACSIVRGFWQRGLVFEPPDIEFVFTSPFTHRQVVGYRLLPNYLYALVQGVVLAALLAAHLPHPVLMAAGLTLLQIIFFHLSTAASLFAGTLPQDLHHRLRCMLLVGSFCLLALYFRVAHRLEIVPASARSAAAQIAFYPAVTLPEVAASPRLHEWARYLTPASSAWKQQLWVPVSYLTALGLGAGLSLWGLLRLRANLFEPALATTCVVAERRLRRRQGREANAADVAHARSARLPALPLYRGVGAIVWKNLLAARRSRRQLLMAFLLTAFFTGSFAALLWNVHGAQRELRPDVPPSPEIVMRHFAFHLGLAFWIATLALFFQRIFPFDFRRDGRHLLDFRTLPVTPLGLALAEVAVPVAFILLCQGVCLIPVLLCARFAWPIVLLLLLAYPAVALALNSVWNLHYLLSARRESAARGEAGSAVSTLLVVVLSFLVFLPSAWTLRFLTRCICAKAGITLFSEGAGDASTADAWLRFIHVGLPLTGAGTLAVQYLVNALLLLLLARLFQNAQVFRDSR